MAAHPRSVLLWKAEGGPNWDSGESQGVQGGNHLHTKYQRDDYTRLSYKFLPS